MRDTDELQKPKHFQWKASQAQREAVQRGRFCGEDVRRPHPHSMDTEGTKKPPHLADMGRKAPTGTRYCFYSNNLHRDLYSFSVMTCYPTKQKHHYKERFIELSGRSLRRQHFFCNGLSVSCYSVGELLCLINLQRERKKRVEYSDNRSEGISQTSDVTNT